MEGLIWNKLDSQITLYLNCNIFPIRARSILELQVCSYHLNIDQDWLNVALSM